MDPMDRREFIKKFFKIGGAILASGYLSPTILIKSLGAKTIPLLSAVEGKDHKKALQAAIENVGGIGKFIKKGDRVVIKPNIAWNREPDLAANTNPEIVSAMVKLCKQAKAKEIIVFDRSCNNPYRTYEKSGIMRAAEKAGAKVIYVNNVTDALYKKVKIPKGKYLKESLVNKYILEADKVINLPVAKVHSSAGLTMALKNWMGVTGDRRGNWHFDLHNAIADFSSIMKPSLTVIDATRIMVESGPTGGSTDYVKKKDLVIASVDQLLADVYTAKRLFNETPAGIPYLQYASRHGVGEINMKSAKIIEKTI